MAKLVLRDLSAPFHRWQHATAERLEKIASGRQLARALRDAALGSAIGSASRMRWETWSAELIGLGDRGLDLPEAIDLNAAALSHSTHAIRKAFADSVAAKRTFLREHGADVATVADLLVARFSEGSKVLLFGNGGSAADAQHIAAEFVNRFVVERPPLPAIALTTDTSALTSIANDYGYAEVFAKQVRALGKPGDVAMAFSTSGTSPSVLRAVTECRRRGIHTVGLTGGTGGKLRTMVDHWLNVSASRETARIQETHILIGHVICQLVDAALYAGKKK